jgi:hypothetical protein
MAKVKGRVGGVDVCFFLLSLLIVLAQDLGGWMDTTEGSTVHSQSDMAFSNILTNSG